MQNTEKQTFRRLLGYISQHKSRIIPGVFFTLIMGLSDAIYAPVFGWIVSGLGQIGGSLKSGGEVHAIVSQEFLDFYTFSYEINGVENAKNALLLIGAFMAAVVLIKGVCVYAKEYLMSSAVQKIVKKFRDQLFSSLVRMKVSYFDTGKTGEIMSKMTNDVQAIENSLLVFVTLMQAFIYAIVFITALLVVDWKLTAFVVAIFPLSGILIRMFSKAIRKVSRNIMAKLADINAFLQEIITAIKIVKVYNRESFEEEKYQKKTKQNYSYSMKANRLVAFLKPTNEIFSTMGMVALILFCGYRIINGDMDIERFTTFAVLVANAYKPIKTLGDSQAAIQKALASSERVFDLIDEDTELKGSEDLPKLKDAKGEVVLKNLVFGYNDDGNVLNDVSLEAKAGETVALVGQSGAGKSTIINVLLKFYDYRAGSITIDGEELRDLNTAYVREMMSLVPQETVLFSGTVRENIRYGYLEADENEIIEAAKAANAHDFIIGLPDGYDTEIGERGVQISGGQRQRLAIARAVIKKPVILLLDEATSALDSESEALVQEATQKIMKDRTAFVIAHRLSTVKNADKIAVIDKGRIAEIGKHDELLKKNGLYKSLHDLQFR